MKKILLSITLLILLALLLIALGQIDDDLSAEAQDLLANAKPAASSQAYLYLNGILAAPDDDPVSVGARLLEEYRKQKEDDSYQVSDYDQPEKLTLPESELNCNTSVDGCLQTLFSADADIDQLLTNYAVLMARADRFYQFNEFATLTRPALDERLVPYQALIDATRLESLAALSRHRDGNSAAAIAALMRQMESLRHAMQFQDTLIGKMVFLSGLNHVLDILTVVVEQADVIAPRIPALVSQHTDMTTVLAREFALFHDVTNQLDKRANLLHEDGNLSGWQARLLFKPNMTSNAMAPVYMDAIGKAALPPVEFVLAISAEYIPEVSTSRLRNYIGTKLAQDQGNQSEAYMPYVARLLDFQAKLMLFNHHLHEQKALATAVNPYYPGEAPVVTEHTACFRVPFEINPNMRCLRLRL